MLTDKLLAAGFDRVIALPGSECGYPEFGSVVIALWGYRAEAKPGETDAWIHPYYFASQRAYIAASAVARGEAGAYLRDDIRVKPIFARLPGFSQGRNTLSYVEGHGSRFHVQIVATERPLPATDRLEDAPHKLSCGDCQRCANACPTGAIDGQEFHRERCLRNWMMSGRPVPEEMRRMGNRLIGCDECQRCCPKNPAPDGETNKPVPLEDLLTRTGEICNALRERIGVNLSIPNRVLGQACLLAGCSGRGELRTMLEPLVHHGSEVVKEHTIWALNQLKA